MKKNLLILSVLLLIAVLTGCSTSLGIKTLVPAKVSLGRIENVIAVAPSKMNSDSYFNNLSFYIPIRVDSSIYVPVEVEAFAYNPSSISYSDVTDSVSDAIEKGLKQGVYTVVGTSKTDSIIRSAKVKKQTVRDTLRDNDINVLITSEISNLNYSEVIKGYYSKRDSRNVYVFTLDQKASMTVTVKAQDVDSLEMLDSYTKPGSTSTSSVIGYLYLDDYSYERYSYGISSPESLFSSILSDFSAEIRDRLTPHYTTSWISLKENKNKDSSLDAAYKFVENDEYRLALKVFEDHYRVYSDSVSGYNAALLHYALAEYDQAKTLCLHVYQKTGDAQALELSSKIDKALEVQKQALDQLRGITRTSQTGEMYGF